MTHQEIINRVARGAELATRRSAELALRAVLETLADRVGAGSTREVAEKLPLETAIYLHDPARAPTPKSFDLDAYLDRISGRLATTRPDALRISRAVLSVIVDAAGEDSTRTLREKLPLTWETLFETKRYYRAPPAPRSSPI